MKSLLLAFFTLVSVSSHAQTEAPELSLREHMQAMAMLLDEVFARSNSNEDFAEAAVKVRELRSHLVRAIAQEPGKAMSLTDPERFAMMAEFHQYLSRVIYLSCSLEQALVGGDTYFPESGSRQDDIRNILHDISVVVGKAHQKFR